MSTIPLYASRGTFAHRLALVAAPAHRALLATGLRGIEKESLRCTPSGALALTPHPPTLGAALTHPQLTTDYSEALLELITPPEHDAARVQADLDEQHRFAYAMLGDELLWNQSMPCPLPADDEIPIAQYGSSNIGRLKHLYRHGLALRYGRTMQCIAGIHYNYSLDEALWPLLQADEGAAGNAGAYQSEGYLALIRNFRRYAWLLMLLFGASPALDAGFLRGRPHALQALEPHTLYLPYATSLRMSDLGYQNTSAQGALRPNYDSLAGYLDSLADAVSQPYAPYQAIGTQRDGKWLQINTNLLQIENEFYSTIRPKRVARSGERPLHALAARGVQYVEVRCLDIDPFEPVGITVETMRFLDAFLLFCVLAPSPPLPADEYRAAQANFLAVAKEGRRPGLELVDGGTRVALSAWADALFAQIADAAAALDTLRDDDAHTAALRAQRAKLADLDATPSARLLAALRAAGTSFAEFSLALSDDHARAFRARPLPPHRLAAFAEMAKTSLEEQQRLERDEVGDFDTFVAAFRAFTLNRFSV